MPGKSGQRPRSISILSFGSNKSGGSVGKIDLTETTKEKHSRRMTSKADPTLAMNELQPAATALEKSTIESIRSIQHRDGNGNLITDPDRSNPTRPRMERPLDTIRSFEAAIDGGYQRRSSYARPDTSDAMTNGFSRRNSYFLGHSNSNSRARTPGDIGGYHGHRNGPSRPYSYVDPYMNQNQQRGPKTIPRNDSDPALYGQNSNPGVYPSHGYQQSYDTVTTASGSGSHGTDQWGNSTNPSSENSSLDRVNHVVKPDLGEAYGFSGFGGAPQFQGPILEEHGYGNPAYGEPGYGHSSNGMGPAAGGYLNRNVNGAPAVPPHVPVKDNGPRVPIRLGASSANVRPDAGDKRKSWLKRRFSRKE